MSEPGAMARLSRQAQDLSLGALHESGLFDQIPRRVTGHGKLGEDHHIGAGFGRLARRADHAIHIAGQVADGGIDLRQRDSHGSPPFYDEVWPPYR